MDTSEQLLDFLCRTCNQRLFETLPYSTANSKPRQECHSIFDIIEKSASLLIAELITTTVPQIEVQSSDELPKKICHKCYEQLQSIYRFQQMCIQTDRDMRQLIANLSLDIKEEPTVEDSHSEEYKEHIIGATQTNDVDMIENVEVKLESCEVPEKDASVSVINEPMDDDAYVAHSDDGVALHSTITIKKEEQQEALPLDIEREEYDFNPASDGDPDYILPVEKEISGFPSGSQSECFSVKSDADQEQPALEAIREDNLVHKLEIKQHLLPTCNCQKKCGSLFSEERLVEILEAYSKMTSAEKKHYINRLAMEQPKITNKSEKTFAYHLPLKSNNNQEVCKTMFLNTLGLTCDCTITFKSKSANLGIVSTKYGRAAAANERKKAAKDALDKSIISHSAKFHPHVSHYKLDYAPNRKYLPSDITIKLMFEDYLKTSNVKVSYQKYAGVLRDQNIGFDAALQYECPTCQPYKIHEKNVDDAHSKEDCETCQAMAAHMRDYKLARAAYKMDENNDWPSTTHAYTVDMQKNLIIPKIRTKDIYFVSRLVCFNETFAALHRQKGREKAQDICVLWHEEIKGRNAADVASTYYKIICESPREVTDFVFWADNGSAQNKNWILYSAFLQIVNQRGGPNSIQIKYAEAGHSYMKADFIHGDIGRNWKQSFKILNFEDLVELIESSSSNYEVQFMAANDFVKFKNVIKTNSPTGTLDASRSQMPRLNDIKIAEFRKGSLEVFYKTSFNTDAVFFSCQLVDQNNIEKFPARNVVKRGINPTKKKEIMKKVVPFIRDIEKKQFWEHLCENPNAKDLGRYLASSN